MAQTSKSGLFKFLMIGLPAAFATGSVLFYRVFAPTCESTMLAEFPAPHRAMKASVFTQKCLVTQVFTTQVSLLAPSVVQPPESANVLTLPGDTLFGRSLGAPEVAIVWDSDSTLVVRYDTTRRAVRSTAPVAGIAIRFEHRR